MPKRSSDGRGRVNIPVLSSLLGLALLSWNIWYGRRLVMCIGDEPLGAGLLSMPDEAPVPARVVATNEYNFTLGICAIVKDMDAYLTEWLDYHLGAMDVARIYLYDNSDEFHLERWHRRTRAHPLYQRVHVVHWLVGGMFSQRGAYTHCVAMWGRNVPKPYFEEVQITGKGTVRTNRMNRTLDISMGHDYLALIDGDEFLMPIGNHTTIRSVIREYLEPFGGALTVNWMLFGTANKTIYSPLPVTKRFHYRDAIAHGVIKTIVKASDMDFVRNPHAVRLLPGKLVRTTLYPGAVHAEQFSKSGSKTGASDPRLPSEALLLYHYRYLSDKEYNEKNCRRGHVDSKNVCAPGTKRAFTADELRARKKPDHLATRPGSVFDDTLFKIFAARVPKYRVFDDELAWGDYT